MENISRFVKDELTGDVFVKEGFIADSMFNDEENRRGILNKKNRSPCYNCELLRISKNNPACISCKKLAAFRVEFLQAMGKNKN